MGELVNGRSKYSDDKRRQAVVEYCVNGLMTKVSESTGIPETTLATWKNKTVWWDDLVVSVRSEINDRILANNLEIATKAAERVLDSLENGDEKLVWDKNKNEYVKILVKPTGKDASVMGGISQDKARVQLNLPSTITGSVGSIADLAKEFNKLANQRVVSVQNPSDDSESD